MPPAIAPPTFTRTLLAMLVSGVLVPILASGQDREGPTDAAWETIAPYFQPPEEWRNDFGDYSSLLPSSDGRLVRNRQQWHQRRAEINQKWTKLLGSWPPLITDPDVELLESKERDDFTQHRIRFEWVPGQKTVGYLLVPDGEGPFPAVVTVYYEPETAIGNGKPHRDFA